MGHSEYEALTRQLIEYLGIEAPPAVSPHQLRIAAGEGLQLGVSLVADNPLLEVLTEESVGEHAGVQLEALMIGNLMGKDTRGATLGLRGEQLVVHKWLYGEWTFRDFRDEVEDILNIASVWVASLQSMR